MKKIILFFIILQFALTGCEFFPSKDTDKKVPENQALIMSDDLDISQEEKDQLVSLFKKARPQQRIIEKDPFKPIITKHKLEQKDNVLSGDSKKDFLINIEYLGVVQIGDSYSALILVGQKKGVYSLKDKIKQLTITDIKNDHIMLVDGSEQYQIQRKR